MYYPTSTDKNRKRKRSLSEELITSRSVPSTDFNPFQRDFNPFQRDFNSLGFDDFDFFKALPGPPSRSSHSGSPIRRPKEETVWMERSHSEGTKRKIQKLELQEIKGIARILTVDDQGSNEALGLGLGLSLPVNIYTSQSSLPPPLCSPDSFTFNPSPSLSPADSTFDPLSPTLLPIPCSAAAITPSSSRPNVIGNFLQRPSFSNRLGTPPPFGSFSSHPPAPIRTNLSTYPLPSFAFDPTVLESSSRKRKFPISSSAQSSPIKRSRSFSAPNYLSRGDLENTPPTGIRVLSRNIYDFPKRRKMKVVEKVEMDGMKGRLRKISTEKFISGSGKDFSIGVPNLISGVREIRSSGLLSQEELLSLHHSNLPKARGGISSTAKNLESIAIPLVATSLFPPITKESLTELDLVKVLKNEQLRHDIVFDSGLMFRPNHDGERGERKKALANRYWIAIAREISSNCRCTTFNSTEKSLECICSSIEARDRVLPSRLDNLISELRDIILSLLPAPSGNVTEVRNSIITVLNPKRFVVSSTNPNESNFNLSLARFVGDVLKRHCAPMRDDGIEEMVKSFGMMSDGGLGDRVAKGLRKAFEMVELMKLDIANHQLRTLRPYLLETSVDFEKQTFRDTSGYSSSTKAIEWIKRSAKLAPKESIQSTITSGLLEILFLSTSVPETLQLDSVRLLALSADVTTLTITHLLILLFKQLTSSVGFFANKLEITQLRQEIAALLPKDSAPFGIGWKKLENPLWREEMKKVLLHLTARAESVIASRTDSSLSSVRINSIPTKEKLNLVQAFFETNFQSNSNLFKLCQSRLSQTLHVIISSIMRKNQGEGKKFGEMITLEKKFICSKAMMANRAYKNSLLPDGIDSLESEVEGFIVKNGLEGEKGIFAVAEKVARIVEFHNAVYGSWYKTQIEQE